MKRVVVSVILAFGRALGLTYYLTRSICTDGYGDDPRIGHAEDCIISREMSMS